MARRMIDPQTIIKSQIVDDKSTVDLNEILEKYGTQDERAKSITLQIYNKQATDETQNYLYDDSGVIGYVITNGAITITKNEEDFIYIQGMITKSDSSTTNVSFIEISDGDYENGIILNCPYLFDVHVIKV